MSDSLYISAQKSLVFTRKENLSKNFDNLETLVIENDKGKDKNVVVKLVYRPANGSIKTFHEYLKLFF